MTPFELRSSLDPSYRGALERLMYFNPRQHELQTGIAVAAAAIEELQSTVSSLNNTIHTKNRHIADLEGTIARLESETVNKQAALDAQADLLQRIESGRLMRLANLLTTDDGRQTTGDGSSTSSRITFHVSRFTRRLSSLVRRPAH